MDGDKVAIAFAWDLDVTTQRANSEMFVSGSKRIESRLQVQRSVFWRSCPQKQERICSVVLEICERSGERRTSRRA